MDLADWAQQPGLNDLHAPPKALGRAALISGLGRQLGMAMGSSLQGTTFGNRMGQRLFAVHMFAGLQGGLANGHMPMVGSGDQHRVDAGFFFEQFTVIVVRPGIGQSLDLQRHCSLSLVHVANGHDLLIEFGEFRQQIAAHLAPHANARKRQTLVG